MNETQQKRFRWRNVQMHTMKWTETWNCSYLPLLLHNIFPSTDVCFTQTVPLFLSIWQTNSSNMKGTKEKNTKFYSTTEQEIKNRLGSKTMKYSSIAILFGRWLANQYWLNSCTEHPIDIADYSMLLNRGWVSLVVPGYSFLSSHPGILRFKTGNLFYEIQKVLISLVCKTYLGMFRSVIAYCTHCSLGGWGQFCIIQIWNCRYS